MTATNLTVRMSTVAGQTQQVVIAGDFGFVPSEGMRLNFGQASHLTVVRVAGLVGSNSVRADAETPYLFETVADAQAFKTALTNRATALGFAVS